MIWLIFAGLTALTLAIVLVPFLKARAAVQSRDQYDLSVYRDQLREVETELDRGTLSADQGDAARLEIQRRILGTADGTKAAPAAPAKPWAMAGAILLALPVLSFGLYLVVGSPSLPDQPYAARAGKIKEMQDQGEMISNMVAGLAARLEQNPNDGNGWAKLGRSLQVLGQKEKSIDAYRKAVALLPGDTASRMELAGLLLQDIPQGSQLPPEFVGLMREILAVDPNNMDALYFSGVAAMQIGDGAKARDFWTEVMVQLPDGDDKAEIKRQIDALR